VYYQFQGWILGVNNVEAIVMAKNLEMFIANVKGEWKREGEYGNVATLQVNEKTRMVLEYKYCKFEGRGFELKIEFAHTNVVGGTYWSHVLGDVVHGPTQHFHWDTRRCLVSEANIILNLAKEIFSEAPDSRFVNL
jgi:hypothetical protein